MRQAEENAREAADELESLDWPTDIAPEANPSPATVATVPLVTRGKRKGQPKPLTAGQYQQVQINAFHDWPNAARHCLDRNDDFTGLSEEQTDSLDEFYATLRASDPESELN